MVQNKKHTLSIYIASTSSGRNRPITAISNH
jgi:hypothetical protein